MANQKSCSKCSQPRVSGQSMCSQHYAEYMRDYRPAANLAKEKQHRAEGFADGVAACIRYCHDRMAGQPFTGYQVAVLLQRNVIGGESGERKQQREFVASLRGM